MQIKYLQSKKKNKYIDSIKLYIDENNRKRLESLSNKSGSTINKLTNSDFYTVINGVKKDSNGYLLIEITSYVDLTRIRENEINEIFKILNLGLVINDKVIEKKVQKKDIILYRIQKDLIC